MDSTFEFMIYFLEKNNKENQKRPVERPEKQKNQEKKQLNPKSISKTSTLGVIQLCFVSCFIMSNKKWAGTPKREFVYI